MARQKALPIIMTVRNPEADEELRNAFVMGEQAEKAKIDDWAWNFDFDVSSPPVIVEIETDIAVESIIKTIIESLERTGSDGAVIAGASLLRRARLAEKLPQALADGNFIFWCASVGSLPITPEAIWQ